MNDNKWARNMIRKYHSLLLKTAKKIRDIQEMMEEDDFMDMKWKCRMAKLLVEIENDATSIINQIKRIRKEWSCLEY